MSVDEDFLSAVSLKGEPAGHMRTREGLQCETVPSAVGMLVRGNRFPNVTVPENPPDVCCTTMFSVFKDCIRGLSRK